MSNLFKKRVYGVQIIKSKNSNYNADFTGSPRTLPDGTVYATDKVSKFNDRKHIGRNDESVIFTKTTYKQDLKPMVLKEVYESHFGPISKHNKVEALKNLLSKIDVRLFGATFALKGADNMNLSIHGPVQVSYGINRFESLLDSGMFTDQISSPYASKEGADQTTLGSQTRSQEAHYVHHFSINPKNISSYIKQIYNITISELLDCKKVKKENELDLDKVTLLHSFFKFDQKFEKENLEVFKKFINDKIDEIKKAFYKNFHLLSNTDIQQLKEAMALATTYYDSTSKKDSENELLMWIELKEDSEKILKNFTELISISTEKGKTKIDFSKVKTYLDKHNDAISKIEFYYEDDFTDIIGFDKFNNTEDENWEIKHFKDLNQVTGEENKEKQDS